jgi:hypothetical protein
MNANDVIECYVNDVAVQLPRRQRNDVAFELRALLNEGLQDRAEASGRAVDAALAVEFLNEFGRPEDVAARYRPAVVVIDAADGQRFLRLTWIGLLIIWSLGLLQRLGQPIASGWDVLGILGQWWVGTVLPSLWWPGLLVACFGLAAWSRRRGTPAADWRPRANDRIVGGRASLVLGMAGIVFGCFVLGNPTWVLNVAWGGQAAPAAYEALTYTDSFLQRQAPWLFALLLLNLPIMAVGLVKGRWPAALLRLETVLTVLICALMLWTVFDGPVLRSPASDGTAKFCLLLIVLMVLVDFGRRWLRRVQPTPVQALGGGA